MLRVHNRMSTAEHLATKFGSPQPLPQRGLRNAALLCQTALGLRLAVANLESPKP